MQIPVEIVAVIITLIAGAILALQGWTLLQVTEHGKDLTVLKQQIHDLPCIHCNPLTLAERNVVRQKALDDNAAAA